MKFNSYLLLLLIIATFLLISPVNAIPGLSSFQGIVKKNGIYVDSVLVVEAYIGGVKLGEGIAYPFQEKSYYAIDVVNGTNGDTVKFKVDGIWTNEEGIYDDGWYINLDLNIGVSEGSTISTTTTTKSTTTTLKNIIIRFTTTKIPVTTTTTTSSDDETKLISNKVDKLSTTTITTSKSIVLANPSNSNVNVKKNNKPIPFIVQNKSDTSSSPSIIGQSINIVKRNSLGFIALIFAFLLGYFLSSSKIEKIKREEEGIVKISSNNEAIGGGKRRSSLEPLN